MISIPLYIFLFLYFIFLAIFAIFVIINLYHLATTGSITFVSFTATIFVYGLAAFVIFSTWYLLQGAPWQTSVSLFGSFNLGNWNSL